MRPIQPPAENLVVSAAKALGIVEHGIDQRRSHDGMLAAAFGMFGGNHDTVALDAVGPCAMRWLASTATARHQEAHQLTETVKLFAGIPNRDDLGISQCPTSALTGRLFGQSLLSRL